jgi:hypothetical protein
MSCSNLMGCYKRSSSWVLGVPEKTCVVFTTLEAQTPWIAYCIFQYISIHHLQSSSTINSITTQFIVQGNSKYMTCIAQNSLESSSFGERGNDVDWEASKIARAKSVFLFIVSTVYCYCYCYWIRHDCLSLLLVIE